MPCDEKRNISFIQVFCVVATIASTAGNEVGVGQNGFQFGQKYFSRVGQRGEKNKNFLTPTRLSRKSREMNTMLKAILPEPRSVQKANSYQLNSDPESKEASDGN
jgi:hypothetical protein